MLILQRGARWYSCTSVSSCSIWLQFHLLLADIPSIALHLLYKWLFQSNQLSPQNWTSYDSQSTDAEWFFLPFQWLDPVFTFVHHEACRHGHTRSLDLWSSYALCMTWQEDWKFYRRLLSTSVITLTRQSSWMQHLDLTLQFTQTFG
jgi:hypothetical protein